MADTIRHRPVLLDEMLAALAPRKGEIHLDGTFGAGGYTRAILEAGASVIALDRDPTAHASAPSFPAALAKRFVLVDSRFSALDAVVADRGLGGIDGVVLDVGVSSMQLDQAERGFSFRFDGPLDMRMGGDGFTAADLVNDLGEKELAALLRTFGEERRAGAVARAVVAERQKGRITTTLELARVLERAIGRPQDLIHPATRTFQALRIVVNDELGELARALFAAERALKPGGRLVVVSFHSLEDRIVKTFFNERTREHAPVSRHMPMGVGHAPTFSPITRGVVTPSEAELAVNPRARSARLRAAKRSDAPPREGDLLAYGVPHLPALDRYLGTA
ncbi:ribosomal RNA small subunit methyltransferase H [Agaricicola taiwanensis]|uniref:Ribosomal RNA small subunit methyltransferase H n=2 Tax=Agaricicola taiwanensis TaxID=591372 RepID=A0A8J2YHA2_9RHOB|nr:ribosomal RNA small subunit methyltransferase H [Agaricicola taiwanensis]